VEKERGRGDAVKKNSLFASASRKAFGEYKSFFKIKRKGVSAVVARGGEREVFETRKPKYKKIRG